MVGNKEVCSICRGTLKKKRNFNKKYHSAFGLYKCRGCFTEMLLPQPSEQLLRKEYKAYYYRRNQYATLRFPKEYFFKELLLTHLQFIPKNSGFKVLELGSGSGDF